MQLTEFPKTQKLFKKYVDIQIEQLIEKSEDLANRYIKERDHILNKRSSSMKSKAQVQKMIVFLERLLAVPENLRQEIEQYRGMRDDDLIQTKKQYEELLELYESQEENSPEQNEKRQKALEQQTEQRQGQHNNSPSELTLSEGEIFAHPKPRAFNKSTIIALSLKALEILTCIIVCFSVIYRLLLKE